LSIANQFITFFEKPKINFGERTIKKGKNPNFAEKTSVTQGKIVIKKHYFQTANTCCKIIQSRKMILCPATSENK